MECLGVCGEENGKCSEMLEPSGVGNGVSFDGAVRAYTEVAGLDCGQKVVGVSGGEVGVMSNGPLFMSWEGGNIFSKGSWTGRGEDNGFFKCMEGGRD